MIQAVEMKDIFTNIKGISTEEMQCNEIKVLKNKSNDVNSVCYSPDGRYLASGNSDGSIKIWKIESGEEIKTLKNLGNIVNSVCYSPDGKYLASGNSGGVIKIWKIESEQEIEILKSISNNVNSVCYSPDGKYLARGNCDGSIKIWERNFVQLTNAYGPARGGALSIAIQGATNNASATYQDNTVCAV